jgi:hypothetical protein
MSTFTLTQEQYEALIAYAQAGAEGDSVAVLDAFLRTIEKANNVTRSLVWIQWQEQDQPLPPTTNFPAVWPPQLRYRLELLSRPVCKADVEEVLRLHARKPVTVLLTKDPGATLGWTKLEDFFTQ